MRIITQLLNSLGGALELPLLLAAVVALLIGVLRLGWTCRFLMKRGRRPLVMQVEYGDVGTEDGENFGVLDARLLSYLSFDELGGYVIAPGADGAAAPGVPAESQEPIPALLRIAFPAEPAYRVDVTWPGPGQRGGMLQATVRISRIPGDRIEASRSFTGESTEALVEAIGSYCVIFLLSQPSITRSTPRWERWNQDYTGYLHYRRGLDIERREGDRTTSLKAYREALEHFDRAARIGPANMLVQLHRGTLLELTGAHAEAVALYQKCCRLWPEHIEVLYRLSTSYKEVTAEAAFPDIVAPIYMVRRQLSYRRLWHAWLRTWRPGHWNPGERRYWRSWIRLRPWDRVSKRTSYLRAVAVAELVLKLSLLIPQRNGSDVSSLPSPADGKEKVRDLMAGLAAVLLHSDHLPAEERLLRPCKSEPQSRAAADPAHIPAYEGLHYRRRATGWLTMFNAACFFSLAIWLPPQYLPDIFTPEEWRRCCAQASIHELGLIHRDPRNALDPNWIDRDPDLEPLRQTSMGKNWMAFIGLRPTRPEDASPLMRSFRQLPRNAPIHGWPWRVPRRAAASNGTHGQPSKSRTDPA
jgi:tetratricopeptide (TPR) repeat protein